MKPTPVTIGLALCEYVIVEEGTRKVSPISIFQKAIYERFPSTPRPFSALVILSDGLGVGTIELAITRLDTDEEIYARRGAIYFPDRLTTVNYRIRVRTCSFPAPGWYLAMLLIDGEWVAHTRLEVVQGELP